MRQPTILASALLLLALGQAAVPAADVFRRAGTEFNAMRPILVPPAKEKEVPATIAVTEFLHHGEIDAEGRNLVVVAKSSQKTVPSRILQLGPGDQCRVAFQVAQGPGIYEIYYGGKPPEKGECPAWTAREGLLLETRQYRECNLNSLDEVRQAFDKAKPFGSDYVVGVRHAGNPFSLGEEPFFSRYTGTLHIPTAGTYGFILSSRDCSFLVIDGKTVASAPGRHEPLYQAKPGSRADVQLSAGPHTFEFHHAVAGPNAIMVAGWEVNPAGPAPQKVAVIPPELFHAVAVARVAPGPVITPKEKVPPDFSVDIAGAVLLPDNNVPLVGVRFTEIFSKAGPNPGRIEWDFGDGQTGEKSPVEHVYLRPGLYSVTMTARRSGKSLSTTSRIFVDHPKVIQPTKQHTLEQYAPILETYDAGRMDAASLRQYIAALHQQVDALAAPSEEAAPGAAPKPAEASKTGDPRRRNPRSREKGKEAAAASKGPMDPAAARKAVEAARKAAAEAAKKAAEAAAERKAAPESPAAVKQHISRLLKAIAEAGRAAFSPDSPAKGDQDLLFVARATAAVARDRLGNSALAGSIWSGASKKISAAELRAECWVRMADVLLNDMDNAAAAKPLLDSAAAVPGLLDRPGDNAARLQRVLGDYHASAGDGEAARKAYRRAESLLRSSRTQAEQTAWQGARGRSTEQFLRTGELDRAAVELHQWQEESPGDVINGYIVLLAAQYWQQRDRGAMAVALAGRLSAINPDSPYRDQLMLLAAECHADAGAGDRAVATLESLLRDLPGSPLVPTVKERLTELKLNPPKAGRPKKKPEPTPEAEMEADEDSADESKEMPAENSAEKAKP